MQSDIDLISFIEPGNTMNALLHSLPARAAQSTVASRHRALPAKVLGPGSRQAMAAPAAVAAKPRRLTRTLRFPAAVIVVAAHAAPLALGLPLAAVPLIVASLGIAAILLSRWSH